MVTESLASTRSAAASARSAADWMELYRFKVRFADAVIVVATVFGTQWAWFALTGAAIAGPVHPYERLLSYTVVSALLAGAWYVALLLSGASGPRVLGTGTGEYRRVLSSTLHLFAVVVIVAFLTSTDISRGYLLISFPLGAVALLVNRAVARRSLWRARRNGDALSRVLVLGDDSESRRIVTELDRAPEAGYQVVGISGPGGRAQFSRNGEPIPHLGEVRDIPALLERTKADTVIVASDASLPVDRVREISWHLEPGRQHLIMVPSLTDIGGPRIHTRPVAGLPLMHVETPRFTRGQRLLKRAFDIVGSGALLVALAPMFLILGLLVRASSAGPVFYRQERIGKAGRPFRMIKFRSMVPDADAMLLALLAEQGKGDVPLFKVENDPRVTPIGRILRKYSLDEFPQLVNVFLGDMSLVGPRPQRREEVAHYDSAAERRLIVKPGMSGLWQVSGRSALSWEDALRLDLYYVENWSLLGDVSILFRTFKAVLAPGATAH